MIGEYKDKIGRIFIIAYIIFAIGTALGSVYYVNFGYESGDIKNTLDTYLNSIKNGLDTQSVIINTIKNNVGFTLMLSGCVFFRAGILFTVFLLARKGFVAGFTAASMIGVFGYKGLITALVSIFQYILVIPILMYFCSVNVLFSARIIAPVKKNIIFYILFLIFIITIFCVESLVEGIFTTTFMRWVLNSVT